MSIAIFDFLSAFSGKLKKSARVAAGYEACYRRWRSIRSFVNPSSIILAVRTHNTRRKLPAQSSNASESSVRDRRIELRTAWSRIPRYTHEIRYRLREERGPSAGEVARDETEETRYRAVAIDRYRVPRTAALVDPPRLRGKRTRAKCPAAFIFSSSSFEWHPISQRFFRDAFLDPPLPFPSCSLSASRSILSEFLSRTVMQKRDIRLCKKVTKAYTAHVRPESIMYHFILKNDKTSKIL